MRRISGLAPITTFFILFTMLLTACGGTSSGGGGTTSSSSGAKAKVALVTDIGGLNDRSFNQLAYGGYTQAQKQYGFTPKVIQTQSQNDYVKNLTLASQSVGPGGLVIAVGFLMQVPLDQIAKQNTTINYAIVDGCALLPSVLTAIRSPMFRPSSLKSSKLDVSSARLPVKWNLMAKPKCQIYSAPTASEPWVAFRSRQSFAILLATSTALRRLTQM